MSATASADRSKPITLWSVGHSTRAADAFLDLLAEWRIAGVADVRTLPRSRRHPQFDGPTLAAALEARGIAYDHVPELGGLRKPRAGSVHTALRDEGFRGFADHMETPVFEGALERLLGLARRTRTAFMCAEADPARCHRSLIADALVVRGVRVVHVIGPGEERPHRLSALARPDGTRLRYPGPGELFGATRRSAAAGS